MKRLASLFLMLLVGCAGVRTRAPEAQDVRTMIDSTVQLHVDMMVTVRLQIENEETKVTETKEYAHQQDGWVGSGVVYDKDSSNTQHPQSMILSANHVLDVPKVGEVLPYEFFGVPIGEKIIESVRVYLTTQDQRTCNVKVLVRGKSDTRDTATGVADCDAGRVAQFATRAPAVGEKIFISGHPDGVPLAIVTEGYVSGWAEGYLWASAPIFGGNSGGPVFYDGKVIGLAVRGFDYPNISIITPLSEIQKRIAQTPAQW
jgi:S1-C subfamily serine protease